MRILEIFDEWSLCGRERFSRLLLFGFPPCYWLIVLHTKVIMVCFSGHSEWGLTTSYLLDPWGWSEFFLQQDLFPIPFSCELVEPVLAICFINIVIDFFFWLIDWFDDFRRFKKLWSLKARLRKSLVLLKKKEVPRAVLWCRYACLVS